MSQQSNHYPEETWEANGLFHEADGRSYGPPDEDWEEYAAWADRLEALRDWETPA
jgi:hypothetical protein